MGMPYLLTQVPLMLVDLPTMCLLLCAMYGFLAALRRGGLMIPVAAVALFLSFYSKYSAWLMLSVLAAIFCVMASHERSTGGGRSVCRRAFVTACISGFLIGIVFVYKAEVFLAQMRLLWEYQKPGLGRWGESFLSTFFSKSIPLFPWPRSLP